MNDHDSETLRTLADRPGVLPLTASHRRPRKTSNARYLYAKPKDCSSCVGGAVKSEMPATADGALVQPRDTLYGVILLYSRTKD
jgi:hypothetical protein